MAENPKFTGIHACSIQGCRICRCSRYAFQPVWGKGPIIANTSIFDQSLRNRRSIQESDLAMIIVEPAAPYITTVLVSCSRSSQLEEVSIQQRLSSHPVPEFPLSPRDLSPYHNHRRGIL